MDASEREHCETLLMALCELARVGTQSAWDRAVDRLGSERSAARDEGYVRGTADHIAEARLAHACSNKLRAELAELRRTPNAATEPKDEAAELKFLRTMSYEWSVPLGVICGWREAARAQGYTEGYENGRAEALRMEGE